jgi:superfamily II DNA or RNA helicase
MSTIFNLIENKAAGWATGEKSKNRSVAGNVLNYIEKMDKLREPQKQAIAVYLWLKFIGNNQKLADIIRGGFLYDRDSVKDIDNSYTFGENCATQFLNHFFLENGVKNLRHKLINDPKSEKINWSAILDDILHNYDYPNYLFSLPMGAGKTYLMASFIYLDLYFAGLYKNDPRFAHNFIVLAPQASKTAILPSLQTIKNFNPEWILPKNDAVKLKQTIQIEILDALGSQRRDKLQGNNPNLEKVSRLAQTKDFGLVFITNAEKIVPERYDEKDKFYTDPQSLLYDQKIAAQITKINELRERLSEIKNLGVILDEVHHSYGVNSQKEAKKLRRAINILNQRKNVAGVLGFSGTPYVRHIVKIADEEIKLSQIQDIVYNYYLNDGIGKFLKVPEIKKADVKESLFIGRALDDFFAGYDIKYKNGARSKIVFYCPLIKTLNEKILPEIRDWYARNRPGKENEIFKFYANAGKENKQYEISKDSLAIFNNLDKPYSDKRVILLVGIGGEGWDCKSLSGVVLPRQKTAKNFVLQTTCRCLREMDDAQNEKALIYLEKENYKTLDNELRENYRLKISDLKFAGQNRIPVAVRKPKLGKLNYKQVKARYEIVAKKTFAGSLAEFDFEKIREKYSYVADITTGRIGRAGLIGEVVKKNRQADSADYSLTDFIYDLARATYGKYGEADLLTGHKKDIQAIFDVIKDNFDWINANPRLEMDDIIKYAASLLMEEIEYKKEIIAENAQIELLEWLGANPAIAYGAESDFRRFLPEVTPRLAEIYKKHRTVLDEALAEIDPQDAGFNYAPYKFDSQFEINALREMLKLSDLKDKGLEIYYNGYNENRDLQSFFIKTADGVYTPDFLVVRRAGKKIAKVLIVETKGKIYDDEDFRKKERFVKNEFRTHNPDFSYVKFVDAKGDNDFSRFMGELRDIIKTF